MAQYVALLRGIGPGNPNMRNERLREAFAALGHQNVRSVISSGNILFETDETDMTALESAIESQLQSQLGIGGCTIVRSEEEMRAFVKTKPYGDVSHTPTSYQLVSFLKDRGITSIDGMMDGDASYRILSFDPNVGAICCIGDTTQKSTPVFMAQLEKYFHKKITSRTWRTVERIVARF